LDGLSGFGYNKTTMTTISNIINANPSLLCDFDKIEVGFSYQFDSKINEAWISEMSHSRISSVYPQSIGIAIPILTFRLGIGLSQLFNSKLDYGTMQGGIVWNNDDGYVETDIYHPIKTEYVIKTAVSISHQLPGVLFNLGKLSIGLQYNDYKLHFNNDLAWTFGPAKFKSSSSNYSFGVVYDLDDVIFKSIRFGIFYEDHFEFSKWYPPHGSSLLHKGFIPEKYHFGVTFNLNSKLDISINNSLILWENLDRLYSIKNNNDLSINFGCHFTNNLKISCGIFSTDHIQNKYTNIFHIDELKAIYIVTGIRFSYNSFLFDFNLSDSHLFSEKLRKQTIFKLGAGYLLGN